MGHDRPRGSVAVVAPSSSLRTSDGAMDIRRLGTIDYAEALDLQRECADRRAADTGDDVLLLLEHPSVYTAGRRTEPSELPTDGSRVIPVDRGGKITWHGPGQLVGYPIIRLAEPIDVVAYVRRLEAALIAICAELGLACGRIDGRSGVWLTEPERKIAAIGVRVARSVTLHGFSLNCDNSFAGFDAIVPCGIADAGVTSLSRELGRDVPVAEVLELAARIVPDFLDGAASVEVPLLGAAPDPLRARVHPAIPSL
ncbi:lipoyl(octanoyl) transferase LipB [Millisia brevis]|uniref:lipoyl(octanoyl) transferase LipB n=1 Tax=Millisia brevis TaxID=264148 RepID=UPI000831405D